MQVSYLWGLKETLIILILRGKSSSDDELSELSGHGYMLHSLVKMGSPTQGAALGFLAILHFL